MEKPSEDKAFQRRNKCSQGVVVGLEGRHHSGREKNWFKDRWNGIEDFKWLDVKTGHLRRGWPWGTLLCTLLRQHWGASVRCLATCAKGLGLCLVLMRAEAITPSGFPSLLCLHWLLYTCWPFPDPAPPTRSAIFLETVVFNSCLLSCILSISQLTTIIPLPQCPTGTALAEVSGPNSWVWAAMFSEFLTYLFGPLLPKCLPAHFHSHSNLFPSLPSRFFNLLLRVRETQLHVFLPAHPSSLD